MSSIAIVGANGRMGASVVFKLYPMTNELSAVVRTKTDRVAPLAETLLLQKEKKVEKEPALSSPRPIIITRDLREAVLGSEAVFFCLCTDDLRNLLAENKANFSKKMLLSCNPEVTADFISDATGSKNVAQFVPSAMLRTEHYGPIQVAYSSSISENGKLNIATALQPLGQPVEIKQSEVRAYSTFAMFPALVADLVWEFAVNSGIGLQQAIPLLQNYVSGTAKLLQIVPPKEIIGTVETPGGETEQARIILDFQTRMKEVFAALRKKE